MNDIEQDRIVKLDFLMALAVLMQQHDVTIKLKHSKNTLDMDVELLNSRRNSTAYSTIEMVRHVGVETEIDSNTIITLLNKEKANV